MEIFFVKIAICFNFLKMYYHYILYNLIISNRVTIRKLLLDFLFLKNVSFKVYFPFYLGLIKETNNERKALQLKIKICSAFFTLFLTLSFVVGYVVHQNQ